MWQRIGFRRLQAAALVLVAAVVAACACLGPLFERQTEQGLSTSSLQAQEPVDRTVSFSATDRAAAIEAAVPAALRSAALPPIVTSSATIDERSPAGHGRRHPLEGRIVAVSDTCGAVVVTSGRCPDAPDQVAVSTFEAGVLGWRVGDQVAVHQVVTTQDGSVVPPFRGTLQVVGIYRPRDPTAADAPVTGRAGQGVGPGSPQVETDDWLTDPATLVPTRWSLVTHQVTYQLPTTVDVDTFVALGRRIEQLTVDSSSLDIGSSPVVVASTLPQVAETVDRGRDQGRRTITALVLQLVALTLIVLWLVLAAAADQRRSEVALARLRGRGRGGAARFLLAELLPLTWLGVVLGCVAALGLSRLVAAVVLPVAVPVQTPPGYWLAALATVLAVPLVVLAGVVRVVRQPVATLLRSVPPRGSTSVAGAAEVVVVAVSLTAVGAFLTGTLKGPLAVVAPTLLSLAVGLLLGRFSTPLAAGVGSALLRRGRTVPALGLLQVARRPETRRVLTVVVVTTGLAAFSASALTVAARNREHAAEQANGAPYVVEVGDTDPTAAQSVADVVARLDPGRRLMTPVVSMAVQGDPDDATIGVDPVAYPRVAYVPSPTPASAWRTIAAPDVPPLRIVGERLTGRLRLVGVEFSDGGSVGGVGGAATLDLDLDVTGNGPVTVPLARLRAGTSTVPLHVSVPCFQGCEVTGLAVHTSPAASMQGTLTLDRLRAHRVGRSRAMGLGPASAWVRVDTQDAQLLPKGTRSSSLTVDVVTTGDTPPVLVRTWAPSVIPALDTGGPSTFEAPGLDSVDEPMSAAGRLVRVPAQTLQAQVVDLQRLLRSGRYPVTNDVVDVYLAHDDPALVARLRAALAAHHLGIIGTSSVGQVRTALDDTPAAWSLDLAGVVGLGALLLGLLVQLVVTSTTWRRRAADLAALRMAGASSRRLRGIGFLEQVPVVVVGVVVGTITGAFGARHALSSVRQFTVTPVVDTTDFSTPWTVVVLTGGAVLVLTTLVSALTALWTVRRAGLERVREVG